MTDRTDPTTTAATEGEGGGPRPGTGTGHDPNDHGPNDHADNRPNDHADNRPVSPPRTAAGPVPEAAQRPGGAGGRPLPRARLSGRPAAALWALRVFVVVLGAMVVYTFVAGLGH